MQSLLQKENSPCMFLSSRRFSPGYVSTDPVEEDKVLEEAVRELSLSIRDSLILTNTQSVTARELVLRKCGQADPLPFIECYPNT